KRPEAGTENPFEGDPGRGTDYVEGMPGALSMDLVSAPEVPDLPQSAWKLTKAGDVVRAEFETAGLLLWREIALPKDPAHPWHADVTFGVKNLTAPAGVARILEIAGPVLPKQTVGDDGVLLAQGGEGGSVELLRAVDVAKLLAET